MKRNKKDRIKRILELSQSGVGKLAGDAGWLLAERAITIASALLIGAWVARYLGAAIFGLLSSVYAISAIIKSVSQCGQNQIVVAELVESKDSERTTLVSSALIQLVVGSFLSVVVSLVWVWNFRGEDPSKIWLLPLATIEILLQPASIIRYWFIGKRIPKFAVIASALSTLVGAMYRVTLIGLGAGVGYFVVTPAIVLCISITIMLYFARGKFPLASISSRSETRTGVLNAARKLASRGGWLFLGTVFSYVMFKSDILMLGVMRTPSEVGYYSAASRISELCFMVPGILASAVLPIVIRARGRTETGARGKVDDSASAYYSLSAFAGITCAITLTILSVALIPILYGEEYRASVSILAIHGWVCIPVFMGAPRFNYILAENIVSKWAKILGVAVVVNFLLNYLLIPKWGGEGAAVATLITCVIASIGTSFCVSELRTHGIAQVTGLLKPFAWISFLRSRAVLT